MIWPGMIAIAVFLVVGCAPPTTIVMKNPQTGAIQQCTNAITYIGRDPAEECAKALERDGWVRLPQK